MTIQKKSLIGKLNTTKKSTDNSTAAQDSPSVSAPVSARFLARQAAVHGRRMARRKK